MKFSTRNQLRNAGADVVKVEMAEGDPYRAYGVSYLAVNQAKRSVQLDLETAEGRSRFERLIAGADVLVDNLRPSARSKLDLGDDTLARLNPGMVHATVTAFGPGPFVERPGFDPCIQALSGMMQAAGSAEEPLNTSTPVHDVAAGASLALGVLAALWHRTRTGTALRVSTSLAAGSSLLQCAEFTDFAGRPASPRGGLDFVGASPGHRFYRTSDGWIGVAAPSARELLAALGDPPDAGAGGDVEAAIEAAVADMGTAAVLTLLEGSSIAAAPVVGESWESDPHLDANGLSHVVVEPTFGRCRVMRGPGSWHRSGVAVVDRMVEAGGDTERLAADGWEALE